ncbi:ash family protein [Lonsdalea quercina]|uniref:ash family protein n=1 Tax=Lonsdalea quercina TaxID=71657 RepID=UPI0039754E18
MRLWPNQERIAFSVDLKNNYQRSPGHLASFLALLSANKTCCDVFIFCDLSLKTPLATANRKRYLLPVPAKSGAGIGTPNITILATRRHCVFFLRRTLSCTQIMVGWAGAPQGAPVPVWPVVPTPFSPPP